MSLKKLLSDYLLFSRKDRLGLLVLISLIAIIYFLPVFFSRDRPLPPQWQESLRLATDSLKASETALQSPSFPRPNPVHTNEPGFLRKKPFRFDPNTLDAAGWERLGLPQRTIQTLLHYREKGGKFRRPEDLKKIWSLPEGFYEAVRDSISLPQTAPALPFSFPTAPVRKLPEIRSVSINTADSAAWEALPGIGGRLALRILAFRDKLGGFYSADQLAEVYGLPDSTYQRIRPFLTGGGAVRNIPVNSAPVEILAAHPYIRWPLARALVAYRNQHGPFKSLDELKNLPLVTDTLYGRLSHYLVLE